MCGIVGYIGDKNAVDIILDGLQAARVPRLRLGGRGGARRRRACRSGARPGASRSWRRSCASSRSTGRIGIGHTRWATHGRPTDENAHPHTDGSGDLVVVHNGIIENYLPIKERLQAEGHVFKSETDTEVIAHLIERHLKDTPELDEAVRRALRELRGSYAIVVLHRQMPDRLVAAKHGAGSVVVGLGENETFLASDIPAILSHTRDVVVLEDEDVAVVTRHGVEITQLDGAPGAADAHRASCGIRSSPRRAATATSCSRRSTSSRAPSPTPARPRRAGGRHRGAARHPARSRRRRRASSASSSWPAARRTTRPSSAASCSSASPGIPPRWTWARSSATATRSLGPETLVVALSQSGETADTLGAVKAARAKGAPIVGITNVVGSALSREATGTLYTHAGPEIGVASSKTFTATLVALLSPGPLARAAGGARCWPRTGASTSRGCWSCRG